MQHTLTTGDAIKLLAAAIPALAASLGIWSASTSWYRRTIGRRRVAYRRLARLGTGANINYFTSVLGRSPAMSATIIHPNYLEYIFDDDPRWDPNQTDDDEVQQATVSKEFVESVFIEKDYFVQTVADLEGTVLAFSVTCRARRFRPRLQLVNFRWTMRMRIKERHFRGSSRNRLIDVTLGKTRFVDIRHDEDDTGPRFEVSVGAHTYRYSEFHYYGNPGHYQTYVFTASDATAVVPMGEIVAVSDETDGIGWSGDEGQKEWRELKATRQFRKESVVSTYTVIGGALLDGNYPTSYGPRHDQVRTIP